MSDQNCVDFDQIVSTGRPVGTSGPASDVPYVQGLRLEAVPKAGLGLHKLCQCPALQASTWHQLHKASKQHSPCTASLFPFFFFSFLFVLVNRPDFQNRVVFLSSFISAVTSPFSVSSAEIPCSLFCPTISVTSDSFPLRNFTCFKFLFHLFFWRGSKQQQYIKPQGA